MTETPPPVVKGQALLQDNAYLNEIRPDMLKFATLQLSDRHEAEDAVQEAFIGALKNAESFANKAALKTWVFAILKYKIADILRFRQKQDKHLVKSDDEEAIKQLMLMRANPSSYQQQFKQAAGGNDVMRTAFGVFTGMIAANLVMDAMYAHQLQDAIASFNLEVESMGGFDNFDMSSYDVSSLDPDSFDMSDFL